jgi:hypothetical protein
MGILSLSLNLYHKFELSYDVLFQKGTELYTSPWTRMLPYIVGGLVAWYLDKNGNKIKMNKVIKKMLTISAGIR